LPCRCVSLGAGSRSRGSDLVLTQDEKISYNSPMWKKYKSLRTDVTATLWISLSVFLCLALYSFSPGDPSLNSLGSSLRPRNWCGYFGSFSADLLYQFFGLSSWVFVCFAMFTGVKTIFTETKKKFEAKPLWMFLTLIVSAALCELYFKDSNFFAGAVTYGGSIGAFLSFRLVKALNFYGTGLLLWTLWILGFLFVTNWTLEQVFTKIFRGSVSGGKLVFGGLSWPTFRLPRFSQVRLPAVALPKVQKTPTIFSNDMEPFIQDEPKEEISVPVTPPKKRKITMSQNVERKVANWKLPEIGILEDPPESRYRIDDKEVNQKSKLLIDKLSQFSVKGEVKGANPGPAVTLFEFKPQADVKISKITELADDLSLALSAESVRIIAPIPGRDVVGIETSNSKRETVYLKDILADDKFWDENVSLPLALGREADGTPTVVDLRRMPHLMVAGTTGSGKSVFVVCALTGLLFRHSPQSLRLILIDPKQVDLATFNDIPHLLMPTICEPKKAVSALKWAVKEMEKRYRSMSKFGARGLEAFNEKMKDLTKEKISEHEEYNKQLQEQKRHNETYYFTHQPYIVIVVEEFGDLMAVDKSNVEQLVVRLAQMARACGIHLILAMQSPRKDVVTGLIKTNIPGRISFKVASKMDSRIILDESGGERLLARGDMLFLAPGTPKPVRHHGPWVTEDEISSVMSYWSDQGAPEFDAAVLSALEGSGGANNPYGDFEDSSNDYDDLYDEILAWVAQSKEVSASLIQRKYRIGYPRAARIIECLEREQVVGPPSGSKPRQVLINSFEK